jgi:hypothetical protein
MSLIDPFFTELAWETPHQDGYLGVTVLKGDTVKWRWFHRFTDHFRGVETVSRDLALWVTYEDGEVSGALLTLVVRIPGKEVEELRANYQLGGDEVLRLDLEVPEDFPEEVPQELKPKPRYEYPYTASNGKINRFRFPRSIRRSG